MRFLARAGLLALGLGIAGCSSCGEKGTKGVDASVAVDAGDVSAPDAEVDAGALDDSAMPATSVTPDLQARMHHLLEAIAQNNPDLAGDVLFPRDAYVAARDSADPQKAWDRKVSTAFRHAVEKTHKHLKGAEHAKFVSFELGKSITQLTPKKKDFKIPLWRVKHSRLTFTVDGKNHHVDIAEMTAWRGAWYVTRLH